MFRIDRQGQLVLNGAPTSGTPLARAGAAHVRGLRARYDAAERAEGAFVVLEALLTISGIVSMDPSVEDYVAREWGTTFRCTPEQVEAAREFWRVYRNVVEATDKVSAARDAVSLTTGIRELFGSLVEAQVAVEGMKSVAEGSTP